MADRMTAPLMKGLLIVCGTIGVGLGILGMLLPLMPTTVFLLLAAACSARSSERFYRGGVEHPWLGAYVQQSREMTARQKSARLALRLRLRLRLLLVAIGAGLTVHVARLPAFRPAGISDPR